MDTISHRIERKSSGKDVDMADNIEVSQVENCNSDGGNREGDVVQETK